MTQIKARSAIADTAGRIDDYLDHVTAGDRDGAAEAAMLLTMALGTLEELRVYTARLEQLTKLKSPDRWQETGRRYIDILPE